MLFLAANPVNNMAEINLWVVIVHLCSSLFIVSVMAFYFWKPTEDFINKNRGKLMENGRIARITVRENQLLRKKLEKERLELSTYKHDVMVQTRKERDNILFTATKNAEKAADAIHRNAQMRVEAMEKAAHDTLKSSVVNFSVGLTEKLIKANITKKTSDHIIDEYISALESGEEKFGV